MAEIKWIVLENEEYSIYSEWYILRILTANKIANQNKQVPTLATVKYWLNK